ISSKILLLILEIGTDLLSNNPKYSIEEFSARFTKADEFKRRLEKVYHAVLDEEELDSKTENTYTQNYNEATDAYLQILTIHQKLQTNTSAHTSKTTASTNILPKIESPRFSSKLEDWPSFIAIFTSLTKDMTNITNLSGEALNMISHLQITDTNFTVALDILTRRYENRRVLIDRFVDIILGLPNITSRSDIRQSFLVPLISAQSALQNLKLPINDCDYVFVSIVVRKLKGDLRTLFERQHTSSETLPTLNNLISFLEEHARCSETEHSSPQNTFRQENTPQAARRYSPVPGPSHQQQQYYTPRLLIRAQHPPTNTHTPVSRPFTHTRPTYLAHPSRSPMLTTPTRPPLLNSPPRTPQANSPTLNNTVRAARVWL
ncbi:uncharacterized protein LOC112056753, partial [Bicyclus anynana]|uniref:Uncharacterized protein LOC112056753 n=1 Tax=Bicyclus anynana TaxID=110368 RepID=A0A6J1P5D1_BICAN